MDIDGERSALRRKPLNNFALAHDQPLNEPLTALTRR